MTQRTADWIGLALLVAGLIYLASINFVHAQDHSGHRSQDVETHIRFYNSWMMPDNRGVSCCHDKDCRPAEVRYINGRLHARQEGDEGDFTPIRPAKIEQDRDSPDGRNHLCGSRYGFNGGQFSVFCFVFGHAG